MELFSSLEVLGFWGKSSRFFSTNKRKMLAVFVNIILLLFIVQEIYLNPDVPMTENIILSLAATAIYELIIYSAD